jgi:sporulation protein YlmC with PRC-barrel domain
MTKPLSPMNRYALALASALLLSTTASAQVAGGTTTTDVNVVESTRLAMGWSVKKTLLGKTVYNGAGQKVGKVEDLIITPDKSVSYVIVGAGGFIGMGRHDVAIPVTQIEDKGGKLVMAGATKDTIQGMAAFSYATDTSRRDAFMAEADRDIAKGKVAVTRLEKKAGMAGAEAKAAMDIELTALKLDLKSAESKLTQMKQASAARWKDFEADVNAATARLRSSTDKATG